VSSASTASSTKAQRTNRECSCWRLQIVVAPGVFLIAVPGVQKFGPDLIGELWFVDRLLRKDWRNDREDQNDAEQFESHEILSSIFKELRPPPDLSGR